MSSAPIAQELVPGQYSVDMRSPRPDVKFTLDGITTDLTLVRTDLDQEYQMRKTSFAVSLRCRKGKVPLVLVQVGDLNDPAKLEKINDAAIWVSFPTEDQKDLKMDVMGAVANDSNRSIKLVWSTSYSHMKSLAMALYDRQKIMVTYHYAPSDVRNIFLGVESPWNDDDIRSIASFAQSCELMIPRF